nr:immunoglobulin light chain junction region [Macaca mulatta]MOW73752.1 immunoglobulin light chain junction region [Macaca mulatta]
CMQGLKFPLTF